MPDDVDVCTNLLLPGQCLLSAIPAKLLQRKEDKDKDMSHSSDGPSETFSHFHIGSLEWSSPPALHFNPNLLHVMVDVTVLLETKSPTSISYNRCGAMKLCGRRGCGWVSWGTGSAVNSYNQAFRREEGVCIQGHTHNSNDTTKSHRGVLIPHPCLTMTRWSVGNWRWRLFWIWSRMCRMCEMCHTLSIKSNSFTPILSLLIYTV